MGMTMSQKILAKHAGLESVSAGQLIMAELDLVHGNDITSPVAIREMKKLALFHGGQQEADGIFLLRKADERVVVMDIGCTGHGPLRSE